MIEPFHGRRWPEKHTIGRSSSHTSVQVISQDKGFQTSNVIRRTDWKKTAKVSNILLVIVTIVLYLILYAIVGLWTKFRPGQISTAAQYLFTSNWLLVTVWFGPYLEWAFQAGVFKIGPKWAIRMAYLIALYSLICAVGGMVVVGQMLQIWGFCTRINGLDL